MTDCEGISCAPPTPGTPGAPLIGVRIDKSSTGKKTLLHGCNSCVSMEAWAEGGMLSDLPAALPSASLTKKVVAEFIGTFILIFAGTATAIVNQKNRRLCQPSGTGSCKRLGCNDPHIVNWPHIWDSCQSICNACICSFAPLSMDSGSRIRRSSNTWLHLCLLHHQVNISSIHDRRGYDSFRELRSGICFGVHHHFHSHVRDYSSSHRHARCG